MNIQLERWTGVILLALLMIFVNSIMAAQEANRQTILSGQVKDSAGASVGKAHIRLTQGQRLVAETTTDTEGRYRFAILPGTYVLSAIANGFQQATENIEILSAVDQTRDISLRVLSVSQTVRVVAEEMYLAPNAGTGTKTDSPIMETPLDVQVVPTQVLKDQQVTALDQAVKDVSGISSNTATYGAGLVDSFTLRGFQTWASFRNGFRLDNFSAFYTGTTQIANVESVEVVKGSGAVLYGRMEPGGMINVLTKQPQDAPSYSIDQLFGSFDLYRTAVDATGPLGRGKVLLYRFNASYNDSGSFLGQVSDRNLFIAPVLKWKIRPCTNITFEFERTHEDNSSHYQHSQSWVGIVGGGLFIKTPKLLK